MVYYFNLFKAGFCLVVLMVLVACSAALRPDLNTTIPELREGNYSLDTRHSRLLFKVDHLGLSQFVGRFNQISASLSFDPERPDQTQLDARIETNSIDVNDPDFEQTLIGSDWLNSERFPAAFFRSKEIELVADNQMKIHGDLILAGYTQPLSLDVKFNGGGYNWLTSSYTLGFSATGQFKRSEFGIESFIPAIGDDIQIEVHGEFLRQ